MADETKPKQFATLSTDRQMALVRFSPCGKWVAAAGRDGTIRRWDLTQADKPVEPPAPPPAEDAKKKPAKPVPPPPPNIPELAPLKGHNGWVSTIAFHPTEPWLFSADTWGELRCWNTAGDQPTPLWQVTDAHDGWLRALALSPDGQALATCGMDKRVYFWSSVDGKKIGELPAQDADPLALAYHPDGKSLVVGDLLGMVRQWDLEKREKTREFDAKALCIKTNLQDVGGVRCLTFDREAKLLAIAGTKPGNGGNVTGSPTILLVDWVSGKTEKTLSMGEKNDVYIHDLALHPDNYFIGVCSGQPGQGKFFFLRPGEETAFFEQKMPNCHSVSVHPSKTRIAIVSNLGKYGQSLSMAREGKYEGNSSPIHLWDVPKAEA